MSPIELPPSTSEEADRRQSHDYPNMTKGNPIQGKIRYRIASMAARFRSAWLGTLVLPKAQGVRGLSPKAKLEKGARLPFVREL
ncbi:uncharacterized protein N7487_008800 [Penicillium crustosum]|uniref:uncharacterized protein n=1 Tax=Penicillium crustosum TaxID=36656 RepID=UPI00239BB0E6|nr:uncharacterized protein N7487_008800 [Penicillium crustosum]KAJ5402904.1 hypothetical protein N7487_008800 [Penicillium crustosum]